MSAAGIRADESASLADRVDALEQIVREQARAIAEMERIVHSLKAEVVVKEQLVMIERDTHDERDGRNMILFLITKKEIKRLNYILDHQEHLDGLFELVPRGKSKASEFMIDLFNMIFDEKNIEDIYETRLKLYDLVKPLLEGKDAPMSDDQVIDLMKHLFKTLGSMSGSVVLRSAEFEFFNWIIPHFSANKSLIDNIKAIAYEHILVLSATPCITPEELWQMCTILISLLKLSPGFDNRKIQSDSYVSTIPNLARVKLPDGVLRKLIPHYGRDNLVDVILSFSAGIVKRRDFDSLLSLYQGACDLNSNAAKLVFSSLEFSLEKGEGGISDETWYQRILTENKLTWGCRAPFLRLMVELGKGNVPAAKPIVASDVDISCVRLKYSSSITRDNVPSF